MIVHSLARSPIPSIRTHRNSSAWNNSKMRMHQIEMKKSVIRQWNPDIYLVDEIRETTIFLVSNSLQSRRSVPCRGRLDKHTFLLVKDAFALNETDSIPKLVQSGNDQFILSSSYGRIQLFLRPCVLIRRQSGNIISCNFFWRKAII